MCGESSHIEASTTASSKSERKSVNHCCERGSGDWFNKVRPSQNQAVNKIEIADPKTGAQRARNRSDIDATMNPKRKKRFLNTRYPVPGSISNARSQFHDLNTITSANRCDTAVNMNRAERI